MTKIRFQAQITNLSVGKYLYDSRLQGVKISIKVIKYWVFNHTEGSGRLGRVIAQIANDIEAIGRYTHQETMNDGK